jgi:hypothetical protein
MENIFFAAFLILSGIIMAISGYGAVLSVILGRRSREAQARHLPKIVTKVGFLITGGVLVVRLVENGASPLSWASWFYLLGLCVSGVGLGMFTFASVKELVLADVAEGKTRFENIERDIVTHGERLDAEEVRNTNIEQTAREARARERP